MPAQQRNVEACRKGHRMSIMHRLTYLVPVLCVSKEGTIIFKTIVLQLIKGYVMKQKTPNFENRNLPCVLFRIFAVQNASAATNTFNGGAGTTNWNTPANWSAAAFQWQLMMLLFPPVIL